MRLEQLLQLGQVAFECKRAKEGRGHKLVDSGIHTIAFSASFFTKPAHLRTGMPPTKAPTLVLNASLAKFTRWNLSSVGC